MHVTGRSRQGMSTLHRASIGGERKACWYAVVGAAILPNFRFKLLGALPRQTRKFSKRYCSDVRTGTRTPSGGRHETLVVPIDPNTRILRLLSGTMPPSQRVLATHCRLNPRWRGQQ